MRPDCPVAPPSSCRAADLRRLKHSRPRVLRGQSLSWAEGRDGWCWALPGPRKTVSETKEAHPQGSSEHRQEKLSTLPLGSECHPLLKPPGDTSLESGMRPGFPSLLSLPRSGSSRTHRACLTFASSSVAGPVPHSSLPLCEELRGERVCRQSRRERQGVVLPPGPSAP